MSTRRPSPNPGYTVLEIIVSMILLGIVLGMVAPLAKRVVEQRRRTESRLAALFEVSNVLERMTEDRAAWPSEGERRTMDLSGNLRSRFQEPELVVSSTVLDEPPGRRFDATFSWREPNGRRASPVTLSAFSFDASEGGSP
ncbi:MAG: type II secretion system GspH family protein [Planctomycetota bacterium]|nr:type II secretion system GspH family protein [Planctomycetota bacterium]